MSTPASTMALMAAMEPSTLGIADGQVADEGGPALGPARLDGVAPTLTACTPIALGARRRRPRASASSSSSPNQAAAVCDVLVAAAGEVDQQDGVAAELAADLHGAGQGVRGLDGGDDALGAAEQRKASMASSSVIGPVLRAPDVEQVGVLRADARGSRGRRRRVRLDGLAVVVLHDVGEGAVQHAGVAGGEARGVAPGRDALAAGLEADEPDATRRR